MYVTELMMWMGPLACLSPFSIKFSWPAFWCKLKKTYFLQNFAANFLLIFSFFSQKLLKMTILTSVCSAQHPNAGRNIQHQGLPPLLHLVFLNVIHLATWQYGNHSFYSMCFIPTIYLVHWDFILQPPQCRSFIQVLLSTPKKSWEDPHHSLKCLIKTRIELRLKLRSKRP